jgi:hypothetical protein
MFGSAIPEIHRRFVASFEALPAKVRARRVVAMIRARARRWLPARRPCPLPAPRAAAPVRMPRPRRVAITLLPRPGPAHVPAQLRGP